MDAGQEFDRAKIEEAFRIMGQYLFVERPPAFRSRLLFTRAEPLGRARFPAGVARAQIALKWPQPDADANPQPVSD
jgi:hypothetical protein